MEAVTAEHVLRCLLGLASAEERGGGIQMVLEHAACSGLPKRTGSVASPQPVLSTDRVCASGRDTVDSSDSVHCHPLVCMLAKSLSHVRLVATL